MNAKQLHALTLRETDVDGALYRLGANEALYTQCLQAFLTDPTLDNLNRALKDSAWDDAFTAAHAMKGLAGNLGFVPLMHTVGQLVVLIRGGRTKEIDEALRLVNSAYRDIADGINQYLAYADETFEGENA